MRIPVAFPDRVLEEGMVLCMPVRSGEYGVPSLRPDRFVRLMRPKRGMGNRVVFEMWQTHKLVNSATGEFVCRGEVISIQRREVTGLTPTQIRKISNWSGFELGENRSELFSRFLTWLQGEFPKIKFEPETELWLVTIQCER